MPLSFEGVSFAYGERAVFRDFSYRFPEAGVVAVTGPSGRGKTTLLRLVAGLERPDRGSILLPEGARVSVVFQEDRLLPTLDARGNVLAVLGGRSEEKLLLADRLLARCGLAGEERRYPPELSGGMRRRVAVARAVAFSAACDGAVILLLDEPFKGLDAALKEQVMHLAFEGRRERLILLATHHEEEIAAADEVLAL